jgi:hypothetical protein
MKLLFLSMANFEWAKRQDNERGDVLNGKRHKRINFKLRNM